MPTNKGKQNASFQVHHKNLDSNQSGTLSSQRNYPVILTEHMHVQQKSCFHEVSEKLLF